MTRRLARIALVAALMVGVVAMHSFGHPSHSKASDNSNAEAASMHQHHMGHGSMGHHEAPEPGSDEDELLGALSMLGLMACGGILLRVAFEALRQF